VPLDKELFAAQKKVALIVGNPTTREESGEGNPKGGRFTPE
jgi:hypothetical protein